MMRSVGLSQRVILGFVVLSLSVAGIMGFALRRFSGLLDSTAHLQVSEDMLIAGSQIQDDLFDLFQTQEIFDQFLSEQNWRHYFEFSTRVGTFLDRVKELRGFRKQNIEVENLKRAGLEMSDLLQNATYTINPNFPIGAVSPDMLGRIRNARNRLHQQIRSLMLQERNQRTHMEGFMKQQLESIRQTMIWVVALVLAGGVAFALYLHRAALSPLKNLMEVMQRTSETTAPGELVPSGAPEMRELIESFNHMGRELNRKETKLSSMLSLAVTVAHEVRNPIAAIGTAIQALEAGYPRDGPDREIFPEILKEVYRVNAIISDLLGFSRPRPITLEDFAIAEFIDELRILMKMFLEEKKIVLEVNIDPPDVRLLGDRDQLHRVFLNLLTNAVDAVGSNGKIFWQAKIHSDTHLMFVIEDSGPGISEADREQIFNPFFSTKVKGTGLGLAIVSDIVERHDGRITVTSGRILSGARFEIELSRNLRPGEPSASLSAPGSVAEGGKS